MLTQSSPFLSFHCVFPHGVEGFFTQLFACFNLAFSGGEGPTLGPCQLGSQVNGLVLLVSVMEKFH